jgi:outer membrane lipoprotein-sorting protein
VEVRILAKGTLFFLCLWLSLSALAAQGPRTWTEKMFVEHLNDASDHFHTLTAALEFTKVTVVVDHKSTETGRLYFSKNRRMLINIDKPEPKEILFTGDKALIYYPKMSQIQEFDLEKHRSLIEQFLLLGFGTKGNDLKDSYLITVLGETSLEGNPNPVLHIELTPKDERIRNQIHKIQLWFDLASWVPVQQKFFEVGGDYLVTRYTEVKVNVPIARSKLSLSAPRNTTRVKPRANL